MTGNKASIENKLAYSSQCDIVLPVFNGLVYVKECINSVIEYTQSEYYHLYIIDDGSDVVTAQYLESVSSQYQNITLIKNEKNQGFLKSCNAGIKQGDADFVLLLNSDVVVVENWLNKLLQCANSDPSIASVNPLTNHASQISIPIASGASFVSMDAYISKISRQQYPDVVTGVGFCMLLRRSALDEVGLFDEVYGHGYCEESDLCMRLTTSGYRTVVADDVYVFHKGSASFKNRNERYISNRKIFDQRWSDIYKKQFKVFKKADPLSYIRNSISLPQRWSPLTSMRETYRNMRNSYRSGDYLGATKVAIKGICQLPFFTEDDVAASSIDKITQSGKLKVTYVLHNLSVAGGVLSVVQLVNELILLGVEARVVALYQYPEMEKWKFYFSPIIYKNKEELINNFPESDIVVATHWTTAPWVSKILSLGKAKKSAYFLQDYESWFFPESDIESRNKVVQTYSMIENKIVKSSWLQSMVHSDGFDSQKIWLGMNLDIFYPRDVPVRNSIRILAMARPRTPRRGFNVLIEAMTIIKKSCESIEVVLFGDDLSQESVPFEYIDMGVIYSQDDLATLYSSSDIYVDASDFQGFGRTGLEAMACETACVLTNVGGVSEYAEDEKNCLFVPPKQPEKIAQAVVRLIDDSELRSMLIQGGMSTAKKFSHKIEAQRTLQYFSQL